MVREVGEGDRAPGGFGLPCAAYRLDLGSLQLEDGRDRRPELLLHAVAGRAQEAEQALAQEEELGGLRRASTLESEQQVRGRLHSIRR